MLQPVEALRQRVDPICFTICSRKPTAPCGTIAAAPRSPCWAWPGALRPWSCCSPMAMALARPAPTFSRTSEPSSSSSCRAVLRCRLAGRKPESLVRFTLDDVDTLTTNLPQITQITPEVSKQCSIQYDTRIFTWAVTGNYPNVFDVRSLKLDQGRFYNPEDEIQRARVAVIGSEAKEKLFSGRNALGEHIRLDGLSFEVIGVLSAKMQEGNDDINRVSLRSLQHHERTEEHALSRLPSGSPTRRRSTRAWNKRSAPSWRRSTNSTRPTVRRWKSST